jgi:IS30 family transposase
MYGFVGGEVSREIKRNGGLTKYRAIKADEKAWDSARRPKLCKLAKMPALQKVVAEKLFLKRSPEQISGWLKCKFSHDKTMRISHETIYRSLYIQSRSVLKKELKKYLRTGRVMRQSKQNNTKGIVRGQIIDGLSIHKRPIEIKKRIVLGHWEGSPISQP